MLSRKTREQAIELMKAVNAGVVRLFSPGGAAMLGEGIAALSAIRDICQQELSAERFGFYRDATDTLGTALKRLQADGESDIAALCHQLLEGLIRELRTEPVKKEIVFLPYKASMWDSLESIWQAAAADKEHCNAYVVAIPYADLTPEHTAKEWHCEKELFPKYVPVLDFRSVDLEKMHPDVIFIHNPYDWANHVTSVDSHYYSSELKKYTETLVYVPYFVSGNYISEALCRAPGVLNADYVVVESENIKTQYKNYYPGGDPPIGKFVALGSPKYDKVQRGTKEEYPLPDKWRYLVQGKRIILYNTSLGASLEDSGQLISKLRDVLDFFRRQKDVVLWWRPHPLMKATLDSMRPQLTEEYRQIEEGYKKEGWGIYDDTSDVTRAIIWTDAYYGDNSSVMELYQKTGKPVLEECLALTTDRGYHPWFPMVASDGETAFFIAAGALFSGLYALTLATNTLTFLGELPIAYDGAFSYGALGKIGTKIIIMPSHGLAGGLEYDLNRQAFKTIPLPTGGWQEGADYANVFQIGSSLYFIGNGTGLIVEYDGRDGTYQFHTSWADGLPLAREALCFAWNGGVQLGDWIYLPVIDSHYVLALDLCTMAGRIHELPADLNFLSLSYDGESIWLAPIRGNQVVRWHIGDRQVERYIFPVAPEARVPLINSLPLAGRQLFFPCTQGEMFSVGYERGDIRKEQEWESRCAISKEENIGTFLQQTAPNGESWLVYIHHHGTLLEIDSPNRIVRKHEIPLAFSDAFRFYESSQSRQANIPHYEMCGLGRSDFLQLVAKCLPIGRQGGIEAGKNIYKWLQGDFTST